MEKINSDTDGIEECEFIKLVCDIAKVEWKDKTGKLQSRTNLSFASKYIHFISKRKTPIYDSYIWIIMIGYLRQHANKNYSFSEPICYDNFYKKFVEFKEFFPLLKDVTNYKIDKFLWQMGKSI